MDEIMHNGTPVPQDEAAEKLTAEFAAIIEQDGVERAACDYISGMTDGYAMEKYGELFIPFAWTVK